MKNDGYDWICAEVIDGAIEIWYLKILLTCASKYLLDVGSIPLACFIVKIDQHVTYLYTF